MAPSSQTDPAAVRQQLVDLLGGFLQTQAIATVARLGVADIVGDQPVAVAEDGHGFAGRLPPGSGSRLGSGSAVLSQPTLSDELPARL